MAKKNLDPKESKEKNLRALYLRPICNMVFGYIDQLSPRELKNLFAAIDSTTNTNCWWAEYELGEMIKENVKIRLDNLTNNPVKVTISEAKS